MKFSCLFFRKPWTKAEDTILLNEFLEHGSKWTLISEKIKGKNVFCVKNRFFHLIKKINGAKISEEFENSMRRNKRVHKTTENQNDVQTNEIKAPITLENSQPNAYQFIPQSCFFFKKKFNVLFFYR